VHAGQDRPGDEEGRGRRNRELYNMYYIFVRTMKRIGYPSSPVGSSAGTWFEQQALSEYASFEAFIGAFRARFGMSAASKTACW
jgi:hypothetical protein